MVTDAVFSMDGDVAPVNELAQACSQHDALLVIDEAHSVLGPHFADLPCEVLRVGTLSKTLGSQGGFVAGKRLMTEMLVNRSRSFIFTTALAPANAAAAKAALEVLRSQEGEQLLGRLRGTSPLQRFGAGASTRGPSRSCPSWSAGSGSARRVRGAPGRGPFRAGYPATDGAAGQLHAFA